MGASLTKKGLKAAADKAIIAARPALEIVKNFTIDFSDEAVKPGTGVVVDVVKATAETFDKTSANYAHTTNTTTPVTVATDTRKKSTFELDDLDVLEDETGAALAGNAEASGRAVGSELIKSVTGKLTAADALAQYTLTGSTLTDFFKIRAFIEKAGVDPVTCVLLLLPDTYVALCSVLNAGIVGDGSVVRGASIGQALGVKAIYSAPTCSDLSAVDTHKGVGFIVPENALAIVNRVVKPLKGTVGGLIEYGEHKDEVSGLVTTHRVIYDANTSTAYWTHEGLIGSKLTRQEISTGVYNGAPGFWQIKVS